MPEISLRSDVVYVRFHCRGIKVTSSRMISIVCSIVNHLVVELDHWHRQTETFEALNMFLQCEMFMKRFVCGDGRSTSTLL